MRRLSPALLAIISILLSSGLTCARNISDEEIMRSFSDDRQSEVGLLNNFTSSSFRKEKTVTVRDATLVVKLLTPINSSLHQAGDPVRAEVVSSNRGDDTVWLPVGSILTGCIDQVSDKNFARTDGAICLSFTSGAYQGKSFELITIPTAKDNRLHPVAQPITKKQVARKVLMAATFVAVPLAIGTGGMSLAITTGAGAVIGGVLADDGKYAQGAIKGAWQGSGLSVLNPIVQQGKSVVLPEGTQFSMKLREPAKVPSSIVHIAQSQQQNPEKSAKLETSAKIIQASAPIDFDDVRLKCDTFLARKDLAHALYLVDQNIDKAPKDQRLIQLRANILSGNEGALQ